VRPSLALVAAVLAAAAPAPARLDPDRPPPGLRHALERAEEAIRAAACDAERRFGEGDPDANAALRGGEGGPRGRRRPHERPPAQPGQCAAGLGPRVRHWDGPSAVRRRSGGRVRPRGSRRAAPAHRAPAPLPRVPRLARGVARGHARVARAGVSAGSRPGVRGRGPAGILVGGGGEAVRGPKASPPSWGWMGGVLARVRCSGH
jgi:hypothetical protein